MSNTAKFVGKRTVEPRKLDMSQMDEQNIIAIYKTFIRDNIKFDGEPEIVDENIRELALGLYEIFISNRDRFPSREV